MRRSKRKRRETVMEKGETDIRERGRKGERFIKESEKRRKWMVTKRERGRDKEK